MTKDANCAHKIKTQYIGDLPIDTLESLPDYFITERDVLDELTGNTVRSLIRTPAAKLFPTANMDNVYALEPNNDAIVIPENQVRACYVVDTGSAVVMRFTDNTHPAMFLAIGHVSDLILCQNSGVINIPEGHDYIVGAQYYAGPDGVPATNMTDAQKIFIPISRTKLLVNI